MDPAGLAPEPVEAVRRRERLARARGARARRDPGTGLLLISLGVAIWAAVFIVFLLLWLAGVNLGSWPAVASTPVVVVSLALVTRGRRLRVAGAEPGLTEGARPPVVYLRPFGADRAEIAKRMSSRVRISPTERFTKTYEERLAHALRSVGPFVAVGDPLESLPQLGAARVYAADEEWQARVTGLTSRAGVVLLHAGTGEGLGWEVNHVVAHCSPERAILSLPLHATRAEPTRQERYDAFLRRFGDVFPRPLPATIGHFQFAYFDADWMPRLLGERHAPVPEGDSERTRALRRLAREFKIAWGPLWARVIVYTAGLLGILAGVEALMNSTG